MKFWFIRDTNMHTYHHFNTLHAFSHVYYYIVCTARRVGDILADKGDRTGLAAARQMYDATIRAERGELAEGRGGGGGGSDAVEVTGVGSEGGDYSTLGNSAFAMATLVKRNTLVPRVYESWTDLRAARQRYFDDLTGLLDVFGSDPLGPAGGRRRTSGRGVLEAKLARELQSQGPGRRGQWD